MEGRNEEFGERTIEELENDCWKAEVSFTSKNNSLQEIVNKCFYRKDPITGKKMKRVGGGGGSGNSNLTFRDED